MLGQGKVGTLDLLGVGNTGPLGLPGQGKVGPPKSAVDRRMDVI